MTFIVRTHWAAGGRLSGIVEVVRTGEKHRFDDVGAISRIIALLLEADDRWPGQPC